MRLTLLVEKAMLLQTTSGKNTDKLIAAFSPVIERSLVKLEATGTTRKL
jgi:hypothetical protein